MISWLDASTGVTAKAGAIEMKLKSTARGRSMGNFLLDKFEFVTRELHRPHLIGQN
jgi:hypothetical protein